jgi:hypothetical protein
VSKIASVSDEEEKADESEEQVVDEHSFQQPAQ